jgi:hypothetical protein
MNEKFTLPLLALGAALLSIGLLWLIVVAFRTGFIKKALLPVLLIVLGVVAAGFIPVYNLYNKPPPQTTKQVFGDSITITGAKKDELAAVMGHKGWKAIQAAKTKDTEGLTDDELAGLTGMTELERLDLNDNPITDATLTRLHELKKLEKVMVARTQATAAGVERLCEALPKLKVLDARGVVGVKASAVLKAWEEGDKSRELIANK